MTDQSANERLTRLEADHTHMKDMLNKLVHISSEVSKAIHQLSDHQLQLDRSYDELSKLNDAKANHETRISLCEQQLDQLNGLPDSVGRNTVITKAGLWIAAAVVTGAIATVWALIESKLT